MGAAIGALGLFCCFLAVTGVKASFGEFAGTVPIVRVRLGAAAAAPTAVMLLLFAAMLIRRPSADGRREKRLFGVVLACLPLVVILPAGLGYGMGTALAKRGYQQCQGPMGSRQFLTRSWARNDTPCPVG